MVSQSILNGEHISYNASFTDALKSAMLCQRGSMNMRDMNSPRSCVMATCSPSRFTNTLGNLGSKWCHPFYAKWENHLKSCFTSAASDIRFKTLMFSTPNHSVLKD